MDLEQFKSRWQDEIEAESGQFKHSPKELTLMLSQVRGSLQKAHRQNTLWLFAIIAGIGICVGGYCNFRFQYSPDRFPQINIELYDICFLTGIFIILLKLLLSTWWTIVFRSLNREKFDTTIKDLLEKLNRQFAYMYRLSIYGSLLLLPPLLFLELRIISPLLGWQLHQSWWLTALCALLIALLCIGMGHYLYRKSFRQDTEQLRMYLSQLEEFNE